MSVTRNQSSLRAVSGLIVGAVLLTACSSGGSSGSAAFSADDAAKKLSATTFQTSGSVARGTTRGSLSGRFAPSGAASVSFPVFVAAGTLRAQLLRTARGSWLRRAETATPPAGVDSVFTTAPGTRHWAALAVAGVGFIAARYDPVALLRASAAQGTQFRRVGGGGRTYQATMTGSFGAGEQQVRIVVDEGSMPREVRIRNASETIEYKITPTKPFKLVPPPANDIADAASLATGPKPAGAYVPVQTATGGGSTLTVLRAPGTAGGECWRGESPSGYKPTLTNAADGGRCLEAVGAGSTLDDQVKFPIDTSEASNFEAIGITVPQGSTVTLGFLDGTSRVLDRDPTSGLALYVGPVGPVPAWVEVTIGGTVVSCGAGPVTTRSDAAGADVDEVRGGIWACVPIPGGP